MAITSQQQRIPLVDLQTGLIRREWLAILFGNDNTAAADITVLGEALAAALAQLVALQTQVDAIAVTESDSLLEQFLQPTFPDLSVSEMIFTPLSTATGTPTDLESLLCDDDGRLLLDDNGLILTDA